MQKTELVEFLEELYRLGGYESQAQWSRDSGYPAPNLSNALNRSNRDGLDGYNLLRLIRGAASRAGTTPTEMTRRAAAADQDGRTAHRLQELEAKVGQLPTRVDLVEAIEQLRIGLLESLATPDIPETQPRKAARSKGR